MKLKALESALSEAEQFGEGLLPKLSLEQYSTPPHLAARLIHAAHAAGDIEGQVVLDLGTGCGVLAAGAALMGASLVFAVDADADALRSAARTFDDVLGDRDVPTLVELLRCDARALPPRLQRGAAGGGVVHTVVCNPPFGTRRKGADMEFLAAACGVATSAVWSLHKSSTREHVRRVATSSLGWSATVVAETRFELPNTYSFHKKEAAVCDVDLWRLIRR